MLLNNTRPGVGEKVNSVVAKWQNVPRAQIKVTGCRRSGWGGRKAQLKVVGRGGT